MIRWYMTVPIVAVRVTYFIGHHRWSWSAWQVWKLRSIYRSHLSNNQDGEDLNDGREYARWLKSLGINENNFYSNWDL